MAVESSTAEVSPFVDPAEADVFHKHKYAAYYLWVVLHEVVGHGTSKLMQQYSDGMYNFDINNRPINPLTNKPITRWYLPGQTWTGQFADLATTVDECRAELVGAYLMDDKELLRLFGHDDRSEIAAEDRK
jgi:dipeptidyl-peptidase III